MPSFNIRRGWKNRRASPGELEKRISASEHPGKNNKSRMTKVLDTVD
jgi:hypothetical protein